MHETLKAVNTLLAYQYVDRFGLPVLPLVPDSRHPTGKWRLTDDQQYTSRNGYRRRGTQTRNPPKSLSHYGVALDETHIVIDLDVKHGKAGIDNWNLIRSFCLPDGVSFPETFTVRTTSGGLHLLYKVQAPVRGAVDAFHALLADWADTSNGTGVDVKAFGGYVVGPGSIVDGKPYLIEDNRDPATLDNATTAWLTQHLGIRNDNAQSPEDLLDQRHQLAQALSCIPNDHRDYEYWVKMGLAIYGATGGSQEGLDLWSEWSSKNYMHDQALCNHKWDHDFLPHTVGAEWIYGLATQHGFIPEASLLQATDDMADVIDFEEARQQIEDLKRQALETTVTKERRSLDHGAFGFDEPEDDPVPLIDKVLPGWSETGTIGFLGGPSGAGKSTALSHLANCLARDIPYHGKEIYQPGGTLIIAGEDLNGHKWRRAAQKRRSQDPDYLPVSISENPKLNLATKEGSAWLVAQIEATKAFMAEQGVALRLVAIDTLRKCISMQDENDNAEATRAMNVLQAVSRQTGVVVLIVHHSPKQARTLSGAGAFIANADFVLYVDADKSDVDSPKRTISVEKSRIGPDMVIGGFEIHAELMREREVDLPGGKTKTFKTYASYVVETEAESRGGNGDGAKKPPGKVNKNQRAEFAALARDLGDDAGFDPAAVFERYIGEHGVVGHRAKAEVKRRFGGWLRTLLEAGDIDMQTAEGAFVADLVDRVSDKGEGLVPVAKAVDEIKRVSWLR